MLKIRSQDSNLWIWWPLKVRPQTCQTRRKFKNPKFIKENLVSDSFRGPPKMDGGILDALVFFKRTLMDIR